VNPTELARQENRQPTWEMALLFPDQGSWSEAEYLDLDVGRHVDFTDGHLEWQPMPDEEHQMIVLFFVNALRAHGGGKAVMAPFPIRLWRSKFREPDVAFMKEENASRRRGKFWEGADLVIEVVSESNRKHDEETKRQEYARAAIDEYWIVDPHRARITVLRHDAGAYVVSGEYGPGDRAASEILPGFAIDVAAALAG
jgi:Uma2 family endonuclease